MNKYNPWNITGKSDGTTSGTGRRLTVSTGGTSVPVGGKGNSPYDSNYNIIGLGQPIQLVIPDGVTNW